MSTHYQISTSIYEEPLYKRACYYALLFLIGYLPGLLTGFLLWG
ncbi:MAG: hypothetical protein M5U09_09775 [Gammaproteobacteria bacterium]|nr:hypothetical protein [Gammaproteobacteria bacterium]